MPAHHPNTLRRRPIAASRWLGLTALLMVGGSLVGCDALKSSSSDEDDTEDTSASDRREKKKKKKRKKKKAGPVVTGAAAYLSTKNGLVVVHGGKLTPLKSKKRVYDTYDGGENAVWFQVLGDGVYHFAEGAMKAAKKGDGVTLLSSVNGVAWGVERKGGNAVAVVSFAADKSERMELSTPIKQVTGLAVSADGIKYLLAANAVHVLDASGNQQTLALPDKSAWGKRGIAITAEGELLVSTYKNVYRLEGGKAKRVVRRMGRLFRTASGDVYISQATSLYRYRNGKHTRIGSLGGYPRGLAIGQDGSLANMNRGKRSVRLVMADGNKTKFPAKGKFPFPLDHNALLTSHGQVWGQSVHGLIITDEDGVHVWARNVVPELEGDVKVLLVTGKVELPKLPEAKPIVIEGNVGADDVEVEVCHVALTRFYGRSPCGRIGDTSIVGKARSSGDGTFLIEGIPTGRWQITYKKDKKWQVRTTKLCGDTKPGETCSVGDVTN